MAEKKKRRKKAQRQNWKPHWTLRMLRRLWLIAFGAFKIALGAAATVAIIVGVCAIVLVGAVGDYLEEERATTIQIPKNEKTEEADFALRISGNSMEPKYHNGDILLVQNTENVEVGELGIFLLDGSGYFKVYGGDRLLSLNPEYGPILLKEYENVRCHGRVVGKLRKK